MAGGTKTKDTKPAPAAPKKGGPAKGADPNGNNATPKGAADPAAVDKTKAHFGPSVAGSKDEALYIPVLPVPDHKLAHSTGLYTDPKTTYFHAANYGRKGKHFDPAQIATWNAAVNDAAAIKRLGEIGFTDGRPYLVTGESGKVVRVAADTIADVAKSLRRPFWSRDNRETTHDVDHILELQIGGWPKNQAVKGISNLELLDSESNRSSGSVIADAIDKAIEKAVKEPQVVDALPKGKKLDPAKVPTEYDVVFLAFQGTKGKGVPSRWSVDDINAAKHIEALKDTASPVSFFDISDPDPAKIKFKKHHLKPEDYVGSSKKPVIYVAGVKRVGISWPDAKAQTKKLDKKEAKALGLEGASLELDLGSEGGADLTKTEGALILTKGLWEYQRTRGPLGPSTVQYTSFKLRRLAHTSHAWKMAIPGITNEKGELKGLSAINFGALDFNGDEFFMGGRIIPSLKPLENVPIDILLVGDSLVVQATFTAGDLKPPKPFTISRAALTIGMRLDGKGFHGEASGRVDFGIDNVGAGFLKAEKGTDTAFELEGGFVFEPKLCDSKIDFWYRKNEWGAKGTLTVPKKRIPGVKSATFTLGYETGKLTAEGDAELDVPAFKKGHVKLEHSDAEGLLIGARFDLADDLPIVKGGYLEGQVKRSPAGDWELSGKGQANLSFAGHSATLIGEYDKGIFDIHADVPFKYKRLKGTIRVGATNREYDKEGRPTGNVAPKLHAYGGGSLEIMLVDPWLKGTAGFEVLPTGSWRLVGEIALTQGVPITKPLLEKTIPIGKPVDVDIDLIQLVVASVFVNIGGSLTAFANIGALTLEQAKFSVKYSPDDDSQTRVTGFGVIALPASVGVRLNLHVGAGLRLLVVKAKVTGNVDVTAQLDFVARLGAAIDWQPGKGIVFAGFAAINAEALMTFSLYAAVDVYVDLWLTTINVYHYSFPKKTLSWKPPLRLGAMFPMTYSEGKSFDVGIDEIKFTGAEIDAEKTFTSMFDRSRSEGAQEDSDE